MAYLQSVSITNFQSIKDVKVDFEPGLTTLVGPSSSGKSAILRALKTLVHNTSRPQVRAGETTLEVSAQLNGHTVAVQRGKSKSAYRLDGEDYTKAGTSVPEPIAKVLNLTNTEPDAHFSFQFDKPYMLAETGSTISAVLARLTQANVLREAVREGARLAQQHTAHAKARRTDVEALATQLREGFTDLPARQTALAEATKHADAAEKIFADVRELQNILEAHGTVSYRLEQLSSVQSVNCHAELEHAESLLKAATDATSLADRVQVLTDALARAEANVRVKQESSKTLHAKHTALLHELGECPTCGQAVA